MSVSQHFGEVIGRCLSVEHLSNYIFVLLIASDNVVGAGLGGDMSLVFFTTVRIS